MPINLLKGIFLISHYFSFQQGTLTQPVTNGEQDHDAVYVVGAVDEVITLRGMNYHPIDIENSILRCHKKIAEW